MYIICRTYIQQILYRDLKHHYNQKRYMPFVLQKNLYSSSLFNMYFYQSIDQYKIKVLVFSIQYTIWKILKQYQYQYPKNTEVSVFSISIFSRKYVHKNTRLVKLSYFIYHYKENLLIIFAIFINGNQSSQVKYQMLYFDFD